MVLGAMVIDPISLATNGFHTSLNLSKTFTVALFGYGFLLPNTVTRSGGYLPGTHPLVNPLSGDDRRDVKVNLYINDSKITQTITKTVKKISINNIQKVEFSNKIKIEVKI